MAKRILPKIDLSVYGNTSLSNFSSPVGGQSVIIEGGGGGSCDNSSCDIASPSPTYPPPSSSEGTSTGASGGGSPTPGAAWSEFSYDIPGAPSWWKAMKPADANDNTNWFAQLNMMIPFLSPEDQRTVANAIYAEDPLNFAHLAPENLSFPRPPDELGGSARMQYLGSDRAQGILNALEGYRSAVGKSADQMGQGFNWLRQVGSLLNDYGGNITKTNYRSLVAGWNPLQQNAPTGYESVGRMISLPFFSTGALFPQTTRLDQSKYFGSANKQLFF